MTLRLSRESRDLLDRQHGVLGRWQAAELGLDRPAMDNVLRSRRWQRLYLGVHAAFTGEPARESLLWAAVLRCGPEAALSHFTAAELDGIRGRQTEAIHVTVPERIRIRFARWEVQSGLPLVIVHRSDRVTHARHPVRTPPRTRVEETVLDLVDLAADFETAFGWLTAACAGRRVLPVHLADAAARRPRLRWRADVLVALDEISGGIHSLLERRFYRRVELPHGLPRPQRQRRWRRGSNSAYLDVFYAEFGVLVEVDGAAWHPIEARWQDIHRDNRLASDGIITLRYSWADITEHPCEVAAEIAAVLRQRGWTGTISRCGCAAS